MDGLDLGARLRQGGGAMSTYEQYDAVSASYDRTRVPIGAEVIAGCLTACGKPLRELTLLDAGCGTGAYTLALAGQVGRIHAVDMSEGMLAVARAKLAEELAAGLVRIDQASVFALPHDDGQFDGVMVNQMLHHLETGEDRDFAGHRRALTEFFRVLGPGGVLVINVCDHEQVRHGFWCYDLLPEALDAVLRRIPAMAELTHMLVDIGFEPPERIVPLDAVFQGNAYFDRRGPLDPAWRQGDSIWALATDAEVARAEARIRALDAAGRLESYFTDQDRKRPDVGQTTFVRAAKKP